jgi:hypothetical protein
MIEFANSLDRFLQFPIIAQPATDLGNPLAPYAELPRPLPRIGHRQHENMVAFATCAFRTMLGVPDRALQQRATQQLAADWQLVDQQQELHFVHHRHANSNFAVIHFFWDRILGTYRRVDAGQNHTT